MTRIILASSSPYRRQILAKLGLEFSCMSPDIDESRLDHETASLLVQRLAGEKAAKCAVDREAAIIIASDQVASLGELILTKPGTHARAREQLLACRNRTVTFYTSVTVLNSESGQQHDAVETTDVVFRNLSDVQIERYLMREQPYDCAGSFKVEGLGISLFNKVIGEDPNTLIGLPLIRLVEFLAREGIEIP